MHLKKGLFVFNLIFSIILLFIFINGYFISLECSLYFFLILIALTTYVLWNCNNKPIFSLIIIFAYSLPFFPLLKQSIIKNNSFCSRMLLVYQTLGDENVSKFIGMISLIGLSGFVIGNSLSNQKKIRKKCKNSSNYNNNRHLRDYKDLKLKTILILSVIIIGVFSLSIPKATIFETSYHTARVSDALINFIKFPAFIYVVYVYLIALNIDLMETYFSKNKKKYKMKTKIFGLLFLWVVVYCGLFRGDRSSAGMIAGLIALWISQTKKEAIILKKKSNNKKVYVVIIIVVCIFAAWSVVRIQAWSGKISWDRIEREFYTYDENGPWMGALYSCVGMADEYLNKHFEYLYGKTYVDYILSIPPSPIAKLINYNRPVDSNSGPGWWYMGYTIGGLHPIVVQFKNFGIIGVFLGMLCYGYISKKIDSLNLKNRFREKLFYGSSFVASLHWIWYGDMYMVRAYMIALIIYELFCFMEKKSRFAFIQNNTKNLFIKRIKYF